MNMNAFIEDIKQQIENKMWDLPIVSADKLGLDIRAGHKLYVGEDFIAVKKHNDRALQYYGGFEYVEDDLRTELGDYVFYFIDEMEEDNRVVDCIDHYRIEHIEVDLC